MKTLIIPLILGLFLQDTTAVLHSLKYFHYGFSGIPNFPEFISSGLVDDAQISRYDSNTQRVVPKQDWMSRVLEFDPQYWETQTQYRLNHQQVFKANIETAKQRFNQTGGIHLYQLMYGCEWDDETDKFSSGFYQFGYDGDDFVAFDLNTQTWTAAKQQAVFTKQKWDNDKAWIAQTKNYLTQICVDWLKKYVDYGKKTLMRTDLPSVSLLQKSPSSPVTCHASGFYPNSAVMFWRKDGKELFDDVEHGEIIPNHDGSFQMSVELLKAPTEDWEKYECVFQLSGVKEDKVTVLDKDVIRTNHEEPTDFTIPIAVAAVILLSTIICVAGYFVCKRRKDKRPPSPPPANAPAVEQQAMLPTENKETPEP